MTVVEPGRSSVRVVQVQTVAAPRWSIRAVLAGVDTVTREIVAFAASKSQAARIAADVAAGEIVKVEVPPDHILSVATSRTPSPVMVLST